MFVKSIFKYCHDNKSILILLVVSFVVYSFLAIYKYINFSYGDWDMAFFNQSLWNLIHGRLYSELYALNTWGTHTEFTFDLAAPFLFLFPHPLTYSFIQIIFFILSAWLFYLMALEDIGDAPALLMTFIYLFFTPNFLAMCHDHNAESLSPFFIMLAVYLFRKGKVGWYYWGLILLLCVKENMTFVGAMLGIWGLFARDRNRFIWGMLPLLISIFYFILVSTWVIPFFRGSPFGFWARYEHLGTNKLEIFLSLFRFETWRFVLSDPWNQRWCLSLFSALFIPAILSPFILLLMLPIFCYHLLSAFAPETTLLNIYALSMTPAIFLAAVNTFKKLKLRRAVLLVICVAILVGCISQMYQYRQAIILKVGFVKHEDIAGKWRLVYRIPKDAAVIATFEFLPALSLRQYLYSFHKIYSREYHEEAEMKRSMFYANQPPFRLPDRVTFALIDYNDKWLRNMMKTDEQYINEKITDFLRDWKEIDSVGTTKLYHRRVPS